MHELLELVGASSQRHDDVDGHVGCVHALVFHLHQRAEGTEEDQAAELVAGLASEGQLVQRPLVLLRAGDAWREPHEGVSLKSGQVISVHESLITTDEETFFISLSFHPGVKTDMFAVSSAIIDLQELLVPFMLSQSNVMKVLCVLVKNKIKHKESRTDVYCCQVVKEVD